MKKENNIELCKIIFIFITIIVIIFSFVFLILHSQKIKYQFECDSGEINLNLLFNQSNFSYFELNKIDGLNCKIKGEIPLYLKQILDK